MPTTIRHDPPAVRRVRPGFALHRGGKLATLSTVPLRDRDDLSLAYTPGVARVCTAIAEHPELVHDLTWKSNVVAVVTDGSAVLGLGDIGPAAALPVMEGKAVLFKQFGGVDAVPICLDAHHASTTSSRPSCGSRRRSAASTSRTSARRAASRSRAGSRNAARHPGLPRRPARHRGRRPGRAAQRRPAHRPHPGRPARRSVGRRRGRGRGHDDPAGGRHRRHRGGRPRAECCTEAATTSPRSRACWRRRPTTAAGPAAWSRRCAAPTSSSACPGGTVPEEAIAAMADDSIVFALANPDPEVHPEVAGPLRAGGRDRPQRLPQPDQQRAGVPRHLPGRAGRPGQLGDRGHEARCGRGTGRRGGRRAVRGPGGPEPVRPAGRARRSRPRCRPRPAATASPGSDLTGLALTRAAAASRAAPGAPAGRGAGPSRRSSWRVPRPRSAIACRSPSTFGRTRCIASKKHDTSR